MADRDYDYERGRYRSERGRYRERRYGDPYEEQDRYSGAYGGPYQYGRGSSGYGERYRESEDYSDTYGEPYRRGGWEYGREGYYNRAYQPSRRREYEERGEERGLWERTKDEVSSWFGDEEAERRRRLDARRTESHRGRGPRGYQRSDERIREEINDRLTEHPDLDASDIEVAVDDGLVTLSGTVYSRWDKRLAEEIAESCSGVKDVYNQLRLSQNRMGETLGTSETESRGTPRAKSARG